METIQPTVDGKKLTPALAGKFESSKNIKVLLEKSKSKVEFKKQGHKEGRMKLTLKFNKDEAQGFNTFCTLAKPENMSQDDFAKFLFYKGIQSLQQDFTKALEEYKTQNPEEFAKIKAEMDGAQETTGSVTISDDTEKT